VGNLLSLLLAVPQQAVDAIGNAEQWVGSSCKLLAGYAVAVGRANLDPDLARRAELQDGLKSWIGNTELRIGQREMIEHDRHAMVGPCCPRLQLDDELSSILAGIKHCD
jgi:hypothetical protein